jgi:type IV pilus assembly protein PilV
MKDTDGFTLLEVLIAVSIFAVGLLAVASMQLTSIQGNAFGNEMTTATFLAQAQLEWLKSQSLDENGPLDPTPDMGFPQPPFVDANNPMDANGTPGGIYNRSWEVLAGPSGDSRRIAVTVAWSSGMGSHSVTLRTITRGGGE